MWCILEIRRIAPTAENGYRTAEQKTKRGFGSWESAKARMDIMNRKGSEILAVVRDRSA